MRGISSLSGGSGRARTPKTVTAVTTAATVWIAAALGLACGLGAWRVALTAMALIVILFFVAKPVERWILARLGRPDLPVDDRDEPPTNANGRP